MFQFCVWMQLIQRRGNVPVLRLDAVDSEKGKCPSRAFDEQSIQGRGNVPALGFENKR